MDFAHRSFNKFCGLPGKPFLFICAVNTVVSCLEFDEQVMHRDLGFTTFLEDLPFNEGLVRCRAPLDETRLITSHKLVAILEDETYNPLLALLATVAVCFTRFKLSADAGRWIASPDQS